jgi:formylglycine-generating enzyme required for sulfatase activity
MMRLTLTTLSLCGVLLLAGCGQQAPGRSESKAAPEPGSAERVVPGAPAKAAVEQPSDMVLIPAGTFQMGDDDEIDAPVHEVEVDAFYMDTQLVTQELFESVMGANPSRWKGAKNPVEQLRWSDAALFCNRRSELDGLQPCYNSETWACDFSADGYRLPTEAEWEYACRAGTTTPYFFGSSAAKIGEYAWFEKNSGGHPRPVGQKKPNPWGLYDVVGNVWEWCNDYYDVDYYTVSPRSNPRGPEQGQNKVLRGGAWRFSDDNCRSGYRYNEAPGSADVCFGYDIYGFRCVRSAKQ